ncbi:unnamed protein product [Rotaria sp. Silwood2]|nr:unnamed protein product [Rotaria sp. Silwood2]
MLILFDKAVIIINKCSYREELSYFDHYQSIFIRSMNILLDIRQIILIGGIAKIDVKHVNSVLEKSRKHIPLENRNDTITCREWFGCHKGYCWVECPGAFPSVTGPQWYYTTKSNDKITCSKDKHCNESWRCFSSYTCSVL